MSRLRILTPILIFIIGSIAFVSCKKDEQEEEPNTTTANPVTGGEEEQENQGTERNWTASVDGAEFLADTFTIAYVYDLTLGTHVFSASNISGRTITLFLTNIETGTYDVDFDNTIVTWQTGTNLFTGGVNPQGVVTITENDGSRISGTFHAELMNFNTGGEVSVTSGVFSNIQFTN